MRVRTCSAMKAQVPAWAGVRSVGLSSFPMVTGVAFLPETIFFGRLVVSFNLPGTCGSDSWSGGDLPSSSAEGASSVPGGLRFLEVWFLGPLACFVAGCFFFFGAVASLRRYPRPQRKVSGPCRVTCVFCFGRWLVLWRVASSSSVAALHGKEGWWEGSTGKWQKWTVNKLEM